MGKVSYSILQASVVYVVYQLYSYSPSTTDSSVPRNFVAEGGLQEIQLRAEDREKGDVEAVAP